MDRRRYASLRIVLFHTIIIHVFDMPDSVYCPVVFILGALVVILTLVQVSPIKIDPWSAIGKVLCAIGRAIGKALKNGTPRQEIKKRFAVSYNMTQNEKSRQHSF